MLDIRFFREHFDEVKAKLATKHFACDCDAVLASDAKRLEALKAFEAARARQQTESKALASLDKTSEAFKEAVRNLKVLSDETKRLEVAFKAAEAEFQALWLTVPNIPDASVPIGKTSQGNKELYQRHPQNEDFSHACPHYELPNFEHGLDFARGNKVTGAGFPFYVGSIARLVRALIAFFLQSARENGYTELLPPLLVNAASATATGQLPDKEGQMYGTGDGFYCIPTAEVPVTNFFRDEIFEERDLPKKYCAYSACFRREAGSWGKDVRGLNRLHQFDKVELVQLLRSEKSFQALHALRKDAEGLLQALELPYRVLEICTGDLGFPHAKQYDLEVWAAGQQRWLEVSSCSCFTDFQARRANIRYRTAEGTLKFVHTLNGSGLAVPRVLAALLENNHLGNGRIRVPSVLKSWVLEEVIQL